MGISSRWVDQDREADAFFPNDPEPVVEAKKTPNFLSERLLKVVLPFQDSHGGGYCSSAFKSETSVRDSSSG